MEPTGNFLDGNSTVSQRVEDFQPAILGQLACNLPLFPESFSNKMLRLGAYRLGSPDVHAVDPGQ